jgi:transcriptional regulator with XRE-family HTH domain
MNLKEIGNKIKEERLKKGMSQAELGELVGLQKQHIYLIELGEKGISFDLAKKILNSLGFDIQTVIKKIKK